MKKGLLKLLLFAALCVPWVTHAQSLGDYTFSTGTDATLWVDMTGSTQILTPSGSDGLASSVQTIGFVFPFGEDTYTQFSVNTDGNLRLGGTVTGTVNYSTPFSSSNANTNNPKINAFGCDGYGVSGSHYVKKKLVGDSMLVVEFCMGTYTTSTRNELYKWQIHLHTNGNIEIVYPASADLPAVNPAVAHQCGLCVDATDGWTISATHVATHFTAGTSTTIATGTWPDANRYYRFTCPVIACPRPGALAVSDLSNDEATISWIDRSGNANSFRVYVSNTPGIDVTTASYTTVTDTFAVISNLQAMTTYYYVVVADCGGGDFSAPTAEKSFVTLLDCGDGYQAISDAVSYGTSSGYTYLTYNYNSSSYAVGRAGILFTPEEMINLGMEGAGTIHALSLHAGATATTVPMKIYMGKTALTSFSGATDTTGLFNNLTLVFDDTLRTTAQEWYTIVLDTVFDYSPDSSLLVYFYRPGLPNGNGTFYYTTTSPAYNAFYGYHSATATSFTFTRTYYRTDIKFDICYEVPSCIRPSNITLVDSSENSFELSWTGCDNATEYLVTYGPTGSLNTTTDVTSTNSIILSNLVPGTTYYIEIRSVCGSDTTFAENFTATTLCAELNMLPYTMNFEGAETGGSTSTTFVNCLTRLNNGTQYFGYPYVSATASYNHTPDGTKGLYWFASTTTGTYGDYQYVVMPAVDTNQYEMNSLQFKFWARATGTSYNPVFQVGVMSHPDSINTFQLVGTVNVGPNTTYTEYTVPLGTFQGHGNYIALRALRPSTSWYATVDDLTIEEMPNCPPVTNLEAVATTGAALLTWNYQDGYDEPDGYDVVYDSITGTNPTTLGVTDPTVTLLGLEAGTSYKVYVRANCGSEYGTWDSVTFSTAVFDCLELDPTTADTVLFSNSTTGQSGCLSYSSYGNTVYQTIYTAAELTAAGLQPGPITGIDLGFTAASSYNKEFTIFLGNSSTTSISNATIEDPNNQTLVYGPASHPVGTSGWQHYDFDNSFTWDGTSSIIMTTFMNQPQGQSQSSSTGLTGYYVSASNKARYRYKDSNPFTLTDFNSGNSGSTYSYRAAIHFYTGDCQTMAICAAPAASVTDVTATTVDISWVPGYDDDEWDLDYREAGTATWTSAATGVTSTSYQFANLNPGTDYEFRVSFECSDNNSTVYSTVVTASTVCLQVAIPYTENFDNLTTGTATSNLTVMPNCWDFTLTGTSTYQAASYFPGVYYSATYASSGNYSLRLYGVGYFMLPEMSAPLDSLMISFYDYYTSASYGGLEVGVMEGNTFVPIENFQDGVNMTVSTHNPIEVSFANYHGNSRTIALRNFYTTSTTTYYAYQYIDDIVVDYIPSCPHVTHLTVDSASTTSVSLSWTAGGSETSWSVSDGTNYYTTADPYITITGLATNTAYTFEVRALCSSDDSSNVWTVEARTECEPYMALPYSENFDSYTTSTTAATNVEVPCWGRLMTGTSSYQTGSYLPMVYYSTSYAHSGNYCMRLYGVGYHTLPQLPCPADSVTISFWATSTSSSYECFLGIMSDPNNQNTFDTIQKIIFPTYSTPQHFEINLQNYTGTGRYIAFRNAYTSASTYYSYIYLDDIEVWHNTDCPSPAANIGTVTNNSIQVTWVDTTGNSYTNGVTILWNTVNSTSGAQSVTVSGGNGHTIAGLTGGTTYYIWVTGECATEPSRPIPLVATTASDCSPVENLTLGGVDYNSFGISWSAPTVGDAATSYVVYLRKCTNTPWASTQIWIMDTVTTNNYLFSNLDPGTTYAYAVRTLCGAGWADYDGGYATTTICEMDTVGDYATNFSAVPIYATYGHSYTQQLYYASELTGIDSINSLAFYQRGYSYNDRNITVYLGNTSKSQFASTTDYIPLSQLTQVYSGMLSGFGWLNLNFDTTFVRDADSNLVLVVDDNTGVANPTTCYWASTEFSTTDYRSLYYYSSSDINPAAPSGTGSNRYYYRNYVVFGNAACEPDGCSAPIVMQSATYTDHVAISWNAISGTSYDVSYRPMGTTNWITVATGVTTGNATINGLGSSFQGEARVSYICNGQTVSGTSQINTLCGPASLPIAEDFQSHDYGHFTRNCWVTGLTNAANADREYPYITALTGASENMLCFLYYGGYVILPEVDTNLSACQIRFKLTQGGSNVRLLFGVIDDATMPIQTMHVLDTLRRSDYDTTASTASITYSFENIPAAYEHSRIAFWDAFSDNYSFLDDIVVELIPACMPASDFTATTTTTSATISWSNNGENATSYYIVYGPRGFSAGQGDTILATGSPVTINGLNHSTNYDAYVYTVCDLLSATSTASSVVQFTTDCAPYSVLPYVMNFENLMPAGSNIATILPNCWASETSTSAVAHVVYTTNSSYATSPQHAFYMYENGVVALPEMGVPLNTLMLSFHENNTNPQSYGLIIGTVANVNPGFAQTFVPYDTIMFNGNQNIYDVTSYFVDYTGTANRMAIMNYNIAGANVSEHYIDDVVIDVAPACIPMQNLRATYLVGDEATIEWMRSNSSAYTVEYGVHGFTLGSGTQNVVSTRSVSLTGLNPQTQYDVYVMSDCDTVFYTFTTPCLAVTLPYLENFDSYTTSTTAATGVQVNCWDAIMTGTATYQTGSYVPQIYYSSTYANSGNYSYRLYGMGYHMLPPMPTSLDSLQLTFFDYTTSTSYLLEVGVVEGNNFIPIQTITSPTSTHVEHTVDFSSYHGSSRIIAFYNHYSSTSTYYSYHYIDDIEVDYIPTCPRVNGLTATAVTSNSVTLGWTNGGSESQWIVSDGTNSVVANSNPYTVMGLSPNTQYTFTVRPLCSVGDTGRARTLVVTTNCMPESLPYTENFDNLTTGTATSNLTVMPGCWSYILTNSSYQTASYYPGVYYSSTYANSGSYSLRLYGVGYFMLPEFNAPIDSLQISFSAYKTSASYELEVGVMEGNTFVPVQTISYAASTHTHHTVYMASYTGTGNRIAFRNSYGTTGYSYHYIDDIVVDYIPSCMPVHNITSPGATPSELDVDWTDLSSANEWQVEYGQTGFTFGQGTQMTVYSHPFTITGLDSATNYDVYVRPICSVGDTGSWNMSTLMSGICDGMIEFYTGNPTGTVNTIPVDNFYNYTLSQTIIDSAELAGIGGISAIAYHYAYTTASTDKTNVDIWIQPTTKTTFASTTDAVALNSSTAVKVYHGALNCSYGWNYFNFDSVYNWDGHSNLLIIVDDNSGVYDGSAYVFSTTACAGNKTLVYYSDSDNPNVSNPSTFGGSKLIYSYRPTMKLVSCGNSICRMPVVSTTSNITYNSATINWSATNISDFEVAVKAANEGTWPAETMVSNATSFNFTGLQPETNYQFRIRSVCDATEGTVSEWALGTFTTAELPCFAPTNVTTTPAYDAVTVDWTPGTDETMWDVHIWNNVTDTFVTVTAHPATIGGLAQTTVYSVAVQALCGNGAVESDYSDTMSFTTLTCAPVSGVAVSEVTYNSAKVTWNGTAQSYDIEYGDHGFGQGQGTKVNGITAQTYTLQGLDPEAQYDVYVRANCDDNNASDWSPVVSFTTTAQIGINTVDGMNVTIFPNPTSTSTTISLSGVSGDVQISIVDMNGRTVMNETMSCDGSCTKQMEVSGLASGAYFVRVSGEGVNMVKKLVVK